MSDFQLVTRFEPAGDQPEAIRQMVEGIEAGLAHQTLLGVTGSGKTFSIANVIAQINRPTLVLAPNKTLAAQLYGEFKAFFPNNAVEYFVSYYDYYQPEAYVPSSDTFIEKDASVNEQIEQMRLSATKAILERPDTIIVATVSAIYGLGDPASYHAMVLHLVRGDRIDQRELLRRLAELQYTRNEMDFRRATYRVRGDVIDIFPAEEEKEAVRIELFDDEVETISIFDPLTGEVLKRVGRITVYPKSHYVTPRATVLKAIEMIKEELTERLAELKEQNKLVEAQRLEQRTRFDIEMLQELGYCNGVENYSRLFSGRAPGDAPPTLFDYLPENALLIADESHVTIPQLGAMYKGDRSRKETLVSFGFRLPSAMDNRPLKFEEWERLAPQMVFVSATPGPYEAKYAGQVVEQVVRCAHGNGRYRRGTLARLPQAQSAGPHLARPGSLRAVQWSRFHAALQPAAPEWLRRQPGRHQEFPSAGQPHRRAPGIWRRPGHRNHHGSAGPGYCQCGGHGVGGKDAGGPVQP